MGKHLQKFMLQADIETAVDDGTLVKPYIAIYGANYEHIDWNTYVPVITFEAGDIYTSSAYGYDYDNYAESGDVSEWWYSSGSPGAARVYFDNLTPEIQAFVNNSRNHDLNRWHFLTGENTFSGLLKNTFYMNEPVAIKYNSSNNILNVIPDNNQYLNEPHVEPFAQWLRNLNIDDGYTYGTGWDAEFYPYRFNTLSFNLTTKDIIPEYFVGLENHDNKIILGIHEYSNTATENSTEYVESLPSIFFDYIDNYHNGTYDGSEVNISSENISPYFVRGGTYGIDYCYYDGFLDNIGYRTYLGYNDNITQMESSTVQTISIETRNNTDYIIFTLSGAYFDSRYHFEICLSDFSIVFYYGDGGSDSGSGNGSGN